MKKFSIPQIVTGDPDLAAIRAVIESDRPYRFPKGYVPWRTVSSVFALALASDPVIADHPSRLIRYVAGRWLGLNAPVYCVQTALLRQLEQTDIPYDTRLLAGITTSLPSSLFLLPENALRTPAGASVNWFLANFSDVEAPVDAVYRHWHFPQLRLEAGFPRNLGAAFLDSEGTAWWVGNNVDADGTLRRVPGRNLGMSPLEEEEIKWVQEVTDLVVQLILLSSNPSGNVEVSSATLEPVEPGSRSSAAAEQRRREKEQFWRPRFLSLESLEQEERPRRAQSSSQGQAEGTHRSPRAHWRRGHWRNQPVGEGRRERELRWIRPVFVKST